MYGFAFLQLFHHFYLGKANSPLAVGFVFMCVSALMKQDLWWSFLTANAVEVLGQNPRVLWAENCCTIKILITLICILGSSDVTQTTASNGSSWRWRLHFTRTRGLEVLILPERRCWMFPPDRPWERGVQSSRPCTPKCLEKFLINCSTVIFNLIGFVFVLSRG